MNDVKLASLELARNARQTSAPQNLPRQLESYGESRQTSGNEASNVQYVRPKEEVRDVEEQSGKQPSESIVKEAVARLNDYVQTTQRDLNFSLDDESGRMVVTVTDRKTNEVVRQIPDELALKLAQNLQQDEPLSLFNVTV